jgi:hypothetical protein
MSGGMGMGHGAPVSGYKLSDVIDGRKRRKRSDSGRRHKRRSIFDKEAKSTSQKESWKLRKELKEKQ